MSDGFDALLSLLMLGGSFWGGKKLGERRTIQFYEDKNRDAEINRLKAEIEKLKVQPPKQVS